MLEPTNHREPNKPREPELPVIEDPVEPGEPKIPEMPPPVEDWEPASWQPHPSEAAARTAARR